MRTKRIVNIGDRFGRLTVVAEGSKPYYYKVQCDCGSPIKEVYKYNLTKGDIRSCGCILKEVVKENVKKAHEANRKHFGCMVCGSDKHYAKGLCKKCYGKASRGTLYKKYEKEYDVKRIPIKEIMI